MSKIIVIGCPGSGKSTFAKELKKVYKNIPLYHLDLIWNKPDKTTITREAFDKTLEEIFKQDSWIIDGNYQRTIKRRIEECDTVFLLDYSLETCLLGATSRVGIKREDMPWVEENLNEEFKQKIMDFEKQKLPEIYKLLNKYNDKNITIFKSREESNEYLRELKSENK